MKSIYYNFVTKRSITHFSHIAPSFLPGGEPTPFCSEGVASAAVGFYEGCTSWSVLRVLDPRLPLRGGDKNTATINALREKTREVQQAIRAANEDDSTMWLRAIELQESCRKLAAGLDVVGKQMLENANEQPVLRATMKDNYFRCQRVEDVYRLFRDQPDIFTRFVQAFGVSQSRLHALRVVLENRNKQGACYDMDAYKRSAGLHIPNAETAAELQECAEKSDFDEMVRILKGRKEGKRKAPLDASVYTAAMPNTNWQDNRELMQYISRLLFEQSTEEACQLMQLYGVCIAAGNTTTLATDLSCIDHLQTWFALRDAGVVTEAFAQQYLGNPELYQQSREFLCRGDIEDCRMVLTEAVSSDCEVIQAIETVRNLTIPETTALLSAQNITVFEDNIQKLCDICDICLGATNVQLGDQHEKVDARRESLSQVEYRSHCATVLDLYAQATYQNAALCSHKKINGGQWRTNHIRIQHIVTTMLRLLQSVAPLDSVYYSFAVPEDVAEKVYKGEVYETSSESVYSPSLYDGIEAEVCKVEQHVTERSCSFEPLSPHNTEHLEKHIEQWCMHTWACICTDAHRIHDVEEQFRVIERQANEWYTRIGKRSPYFYFYLKKSKIRKDIRAHSALKEAYDAAIEAFVEELELSRKDMQSYDEDGGFFDLDVVLQSTQEGVANDLRTSEETLQRAYREVCSEASSIDIVDERLILEYLRKGCEQEIIRHCRECSTNLAR